MTGGYPWFTEPVLPEAEWDELLVEAQHTTV
jgi:hypothetical protein